MGMCVVRDVRFGKINGFNLFGGCIWSRINALVTALALLVAYTEAWKV